MCHRCRWPRQPKPICLSLIQLTLFSVNETLKVEFNWVGWNFLKPRNFEPFLAIGFPSWLFSDHLPAMMIGLRSKLVSNLSFFCHQNLCITHNLIIMSSLSSWKGSRGIRKSISCIGQGSLGKGSNICYSIFCNNHHHHHHELLAKVFIFKISFLCLPILKICAYFMLLWNVQPCEQRLNSHFHKNAQIKRIQHPLEMEKSLHWVEYQAESFFFSSSFFSVALMGPPWLWKCSIKLALYS